LAIADSFSLSNIIKENKEDLLEGIQKYEKQRLEVVSEIVLLSRKTGIERQNSYEKEDFNKSDFMAHERYVSRDNLYYVNKIENIETYKNELVKINGELWTNFMIKKQNSYKSLEELIEVSKKVWNEEMNEEEKMEIIKTSCKRLEKLKNTEFVFHKEHDLFNNVKEEDLKILEDMNITYEKKFSMLFLIFASGKNFEQVIDELKLRINNNLDEEIKNTFIQMNLIVENRLKNWWNNNLLF
jgi:hypothetical protein